MILLAAPRCRLKNRLAASANLSPLRLMILVMTPPLARRFILAMCQSMALMLGWLYRLAMGTALARQSQWLLLIVRPWQRQRIFRFWCWGVSAAPPWLKAMFYMILKMQ